MSIATRCSLFVVMPVLLLACEDVALDPETGAAVLLKDDAAPPATQSDAGPTPVTDAPLPGGGGTYTGPGDVVPPVGTQGNPIDARCTNTLATQGTVYAAVSSGLDPNITVSNARMWGYVNTAVQNTSFCDALASESALMRGYAVGQGWTSSLGVSPAYPAPACTPPYAPGDLSMFRVSGAGASFPGVSQVRCATTDLPGGAPRSDLATDVCSTRALQLGCQAEINAGYWP